MNQTIKTTPKDFFLNLGATVALYLSVIAIINLIFSIADYYLPDALNNYFNASSIAWPISMLVIIIPILYVIEFLINKDISKTPEKRELWIYRWRIYLTIFLTIALIGTDLIVLINTYLNGEISARFIYKVLAVLIVGGVIGKYYFFNIYTNFKISKFVVKANAWFGLLLVVVAIVFGFIAVGSPTKQRAFKFDSQRVSDLQNIQSQIINYWQTKASLPKTLTDLNDPIANSIIPKDPDTNLSYEYSITNNLQFKLCAVFSLKSQDNINRTIYSPAYIGDSWKHDSGRVCFERTIDQQRYPATQAQVKQ